jgi:L-methionine (R)-S-oxide reductase
MRTDTQEWLKQFLQNHRGVAGTVHRLGQELLEIEAAVNIPEPVLRATATIPRGKGMAGIAWEKNEPVQTCNLQDPGASAAVQPGARAVAAGAAVALPVHDAAGSVRAIVGIAFVETGELGREDVATLARAAATLP